MTDLGDLVDSLKREVAIPGTFAMVFPNTTDDDLTGTLADGVAETQLDGRWFRLHLDSLLAVVAKPLPRSVGTETSAFVVTSGQCLETTLHKRPILGRPRRPAAVVG